MDMKFKKNNKQNAQQGANTNNAAPSTQKVNPEKK
jgi:hypothetical protein